jgi:hypothetical protein
MYGATSENCSRWLDGSNFELPREIAVFASTPTPSTGLGIQLSLAYILPSGTRAQFSNHEFSLTNPRGSAFAIGSVVHVERDVGNSPIAAMSSLPLSLEAGSQAARVIYRVVIEFSSTIPPRFDFKPPDMIVDGKQYPVRTFTYRFFDDRKVYGLCT